MWFRVYKGYFITSSIGSCIYGVFANYTRYNNKLTYDNAVNATSNMVLAGLAYGMVGYAALPYYVIHKLQK